MQLVSRIRNATPAAALLAAIGATLAGALQGDDVSQDPEVTRSRPQVHGAAPRGCCQGLTNLAAMVAESDLVFEGSVLRIDYANSTFAGPDHAELPHTFVTYAVNRVLSGEAPGQTVTLRFLGGQNPTTGLYLHSSITPHFDVGDQDILFVAGNGDRLSPLAYNRSGRLRIIDGQVYTDTGTAVRLSASGELEFGEHHALDDVMNTFIEGEVVQTQQVHGAATGPSTAMAPQPLLAALEQMGAAQPTRPGAFRSAYPWEVFLSPSFAAAPAPAQPFEAEHVPTLEEQQQRAIDEQQERIARQGLRRTAGRERRDVSASETSTDAESH